MQLERIDFVVECKRWNDNWSETKWTMVEFYYICVPKTLVVSFTGLISSPNLGTL